jgi:hypothetical protein
MKHALLAAALALGSLTRAEDYQCGDPVCVARITEDGVVNDVYFRKGDMVSTDAGWSVSTDDGWVKIKGVGKPYSRPLWGNGAVFRVAYLVGWHGVVTNVPTNVPPTAHGSYAAAMPVWISLVGV